MPVYQNITNAELLLSREEGLRPSATIKQLEKFNGSEAFYGRFVNDKTLARTADGWSFSGTVGTSPDTISFIPDGSIVPNRTTALAADDTANDQVTAGNSYSAFGFVRWSVGANNYSVPFTITGDGPHGSGSTFVVGTATGSPATHPQAAGSKINCAAGSITFSMTGAATKPQIEVVYEPRFAGYRIGEDNPLLNRPNFITKTTYVAAGDITAEPAHYASGSTGAVKTEKMFSAGSKLGDGARTIIYYYTDSANPTKPTMKFDILDTVLAADLA